ncbi:unnamed protein product [Ceratitis capitata]|uniref:(Mediterranean fruit fly) hypothetical protein n=1 Tax=Ceratitis capitata TaxID=7213 RepID=A0A811V2U4_CERCA|nr:unnamed protein product [Ceratitis capitata]
MVGDTYKRKNCNSTEGTDAAFGPLIKIPISIFGRGANSDNNQQLLTSSSIPVTLFDGGRTVNLALKLPLNIHTNPDVVCNIKKHSDLAKFLQKFKIIIIVAAWVVKRAPSATQCVLINDNPTQSISAQPNVEIEEISLSICIISTIPAADGLKPSLISMEAFTTYVPGTFYSLSFDLLLKCPFPTVYYPWISHQADITYLTHMEIKA